LALSDSEVGDSVHTVVVSLTLSAEIGDQLDHLSAGHRAGLLALSRAGAEGILARLFVEANGALELDRGGDVAAILGRLNAALRDVRQGVSEVVIVILTDGLLAAALAGREGRHEVHVTLAIAGDGGAFLHALNGGDMGLDSVVLDESELAHCA